MTQTEGPSQYFKAYYNDNSLLIQFVVAEFVATNQLISQIKLLARTAFQSSQALDPFLQSLYQQFQQLIGISVDSEHHSASHWIKGPLTKLKNYCEQFAVNTRHQHKHSLVLYTYVHQAWLSAMRNLELLNILQQNMATQMSHSILLTIKRSLNHLDLRLNAITKQIPRLLASYKEDENVLFFIFRKKDSLAQIYGIDFMHKFFKGPSQIDEISQFLIEKYTQRGFIHLLPAIHQSALANS